HPTKRLRLCSKPKAPGRPPTWLSSAMTFTCWSFYTQHGTCGVTGCPASGRYQRTENPPSSQPLIRCRPPVDLPSRGHSDARKIIGPRCGRPRNNEPRQIFLTFALLPRHSLACTESKTGSERPTC